MDFSPEVAKVYLLNIRPSKNDVVVSETRFGFLWAPDVIRDKTPPSKTHNEHTKILLEVPA